jgi:triosephosphate isomerase
MESDEIIAKKIKAAYRNQLKPMLCVGETEEERKQGATNDKIASQLKSALEGITEEQAKLLTVAYEPLWAIGTGNTATAKDAQDVCLFIRRQLEEIVGETAARHIRILYGGSVKETNAAQFCIKGIDGVLVGGASLKVDSFAKIVRSF